VPLVLPPASTANRWARTLPLIALGALILLVTALGGDADAAVAATVINNPPRASHNITAFPQRDFVSADGYAIDDTVTVEVIHPSGVVRSTVSGLVPQDDDTTAGFDGIVEVNHPGGFCWDTVTPDIRPHDRVRITVDSGPNAGIADETTVADVTAGRPSQTFPGTIEIHGTAQDAAGAPLPLDQVEQRLVAPNQIFARSGKRTLRAPLAVTGGTLAYDAPGSTHWTATYSGLSDEDVALALGAESRGMWLGGDPAAATEATIFENGAGVVAGPAAPCSAPLEKLPPPPGSELVPPSVPQSLTATVTNANTVTLSWGASTDNVGVTGYGVYRDGVAIWNVQNADGTAPAPTGFVDKNVPPGSYTYTVDAQDEVGNRSDLSNGAPATATLNAAPAMAVNEPPVGKEITAFPSRDFVDVAGFADGESATIQVIRDGHIVSASEGLIPTDGVVEVNHPGGGCWDGTTPELRAGDIVRALTYGPDGTQTAADQLTVANVTAEVAVQTAPDTVKIHGTAAGHDGKPLPIDQIEQRLVSSSARPFEKNSRRTLRAPTDGDMAYDTTDNPRGVQWTATYTGLSAADVQKALAVESRVMWLGRDPLAGVELTIFENGLADPPGPAPGFCSAALEPIDAAAPAAPTVTATKHEAARTVDLAWTGATDNAYVYGYRIFRDGQELSDVGRLATSFTDTDVKPGSHTYTVAAYDSASPRGAGATDVERLQNGLGKPYGNLSAQSAPASVTLADVQAPTAPKGLTGRATGGDVDLAWTASDDDTAVVAYGVYRDGMKVADVNSPTLAYTDAGRGPGSYGYAVDAVDAAGNRSAKSAVVTVTVTAMADVTAPTVPQDVKAATPDIHGRDVTITWTAASDTVGVNGYRVYRDGTAIGDVNGSTLAYTDANLAPETYAYTVDAVDSAGNRSARSAVATAVVANDPPPSPHSITVFPQRDFVSADGYPAGSYVVEVFRDGTLVSRSEPTASVAGLVEINHAGNGGCWTVNTPDIRRGDVVRITGADGVADQTTTANVTAGRPIQTAADTVVVKGTAVDGAGGRIDSSQLEQRLISGKDLFDNGRRSLLAPGDGTIAYDSPTATTWTATYRGLGPADVTRALAAESRALWLGRAALAGNELTIYENGPGAVGGPAGAPCTAPLEPTAPQATVAPASVDFGDRVALSTTAPAKTVTVTNSATAPVSIRSVYLAGANVPEAFKIASNTCGASLAAGASCTVGVTFSPGASQSVRTASLNLATDAANEGSPIVTLTGQGYDAAAPNATAPVAGLTTGSQVGVNATIGNSTLPVRVTWTGVNATKYEVQYSANGSTTWTPAGTPTTASATVSLPMGTFLSQSTYQFRVRAAKVVGSVTTWSDWAAGSRFTLTPVDSALTTGLSYNGTWTTQNVAGAYGGSVRFATTAKDKVQFNKIAFTVTGSVAWIGTTGPGMGRASVSIDGGPAQTIELYSATQKAATLVYANDFGQVAKEHQVVVQVLGTKAAASSGTRVDLDGFAALR
jgi:hypothetical protein